MFSYKGESTDSSKSRILSRSPVVSYCLRPHGLYPTRILCPGILWAKNTGMDWYFSSRDLPNPGIEPNLLCLTYMGRWAPLLLVPPGKPPLSVTKKIINRPSRERKTDCLSKIWSLWLQGIWFLTLLASSWELLSYVKIYLEGWNFLPPGKVLQLSKRWWERDWTKAENIIGKEKKRKLQRHNKNIHPFSRSS